MDIGNVANSFFLMRMPRIKEILGKKIVTFTPSDIDPNSIKFIDKNQESQYLLHREKNNEKSEKINILIKNKKINQFID